VTAVCSTANVDLARSLSADRVVDYTKEDFTQLAERHDLMLDIAGSRPFRQFRRVLTPKAIVVLIGAKFPSNKRLGPAVSTSGRCMHRPTAALQVGVLGSSMRDVRARDQVRTSR